MNGYVTPCTVLEMEESSFFSRAQKYKPIRVLARFWKNNAFIIRFYHLIPDGDIEDIHADYEEEKVDGKFIPIGRYKKK